MRCGQSSRRRPYKWGNSRKFWWFWSMINSIARFSLSRSCTEIRRRSKSWLTLGINSHKLKKKIITIPRRGKRSVISASSRAKMKGILSPTKRIFHTSTRKISTAVGWRPATAREESNPILVLFKNPFKNGKVKPKCKEIPAMARCTPAKVSHILSLQPHQASGQLNTSHLIMIIWAHNRNKTWSLGCISTIATRKGKRRRSKSKEKGWRPNWINVPSSPFLIDLEQWASPRSRASKWRDTRRQ